MAGRFLKRTAWVVLSTAVLALVLILALLWLAGREAALPHLVRLLQSETGGAVAVEGATGSLYGPLHIARLVVDTPSAKLTATGAVLDWSPWDLLQGRLLRVDSLRVDNLRVDLKPTPEEPARMPADLQPGLDFRLARVEVGGALVVDGARSYRFDGVDLSLAYQDRAYRLDLRQAGTPWGKLHAGLRLGGVRPFPAAGSAGLETKVEGQPARMDATVSGSLVRLLVKALADGGQARAEAVLALRPFEPLWLQNLQVSASGVDPAYWNRAWPRALLGLDMSLASGPKGALVGQFAVTNKEPGLLDRHRVPLVTLSGNISGAGDQVEVTGLAADLGAGGRLTGTGKVEGKRFSLQLAAANLNLRGVRSDLTATRLAGPLTASGDDAAQSITFDLAQKNYRIAAALRHDAQRLQIGKLEAEAWGGRLKADGVLDLAGNRRFQVKGRLVRFDPSRFGEFPQGNITASLEASGALNPNWSAKVRARVNDSSLRGAPLSGSIAMDASPEGIRDADIALRLGGNQVAAHGAFGRPGDRLDWRLDAGDLAVVEPDLGGRLKASGTLKGTLAAPGGRFHAEGSGLRWTSRYRVQSLRGDGEVEGGAKGRLQLSLDLVGVHLPQTQLERISVKGVGTLAAHEVEIGLRGTDLAAQGHFSGGWQAGEGWTGFIQALNNRGQYPVALRRPARLAFGPKHFLLQGAELEIAGGHLTVESLAWGGGGLTGRGAWTGIQMATLQRWLGGKDWPATTSLVLGGQWNLAEGKDGPVGSVDLHRESGDVTVLSDPAVALGLSRLSVRARFSGNRAEAGFDLAGARIGHAAGKAQTTLSRKGTKWGIGGDAPFSLSAQAELPSVAWISPFLGGETAVDGAFEASLSGTGTLADPQFNGEIRGKGLRVVLERYGVDLRDGTVRAVLQGDRINIGEFRFRGGKGTLDGKGEMVLARGKPAGRLDVAADKLEVLSMPNSHLTVSGTGRVTLAQQTIRVTGKLRADEGLVELPKADAPTLSSDVVVLGRPALVDQGGMPYGVAADLDLDLGDHFFLKGRGVDAQLAGAVRIRAEKGELPRGSGTIRVVKGSYSAYGQRLSIERGILNFAGPLDNPGLNILALRKNQPVEAGVSITGTALAPRVTLVSTPNVPDGEKLSWLVLGHGLDSATKSDFGAMQAAAGALLAAGESVTLQAQVARALGVEEFSLRGGSDLAGTVVALGKRLSSRVFVTYEQAVSGATSLVRIQYTLSKRWSVRAQTGTSSAIDVFYTLSFD